MSSRILKRKTIKLILFFVCLVMTFFIFRDPVTSPRIQLQHQYSLDSSLAPMASLESFLHRITIRQELLESACSENTFPYLLDRVYVERKSQFVYCPIFKAATSTWLKIMALMGGIPEHEVHSTEAIILARKYFDELSSVPGNKGTLIIIRHPFERIVSCYRDKFENPQKNLYYYKLYGQQMVQRLRKVPIGTSIEKKRQLLNEVLQHLSFNGKTPIQPDNVYANPLGPTFLEFVDYITTKKYPDDAHWRPYYMQCGPCKIQYDFILRFETLKEEIMYLLQYLKQPESLNKILVNPTEKGNLTDQSITCNYFSQINATIYNHLVQKYDIDFKLFDYNSNFYLSCVKDK